MDKGGMCEKRDGEDSGESDEERKSWIAEFGLVWLLPYYNENPKTGSNQLFLEARPR